MLSPKMFNTIVVELCALLSYSVSSAAHHSAVVVLAAGYGAVGNSAETTTKMLLFFRCLQTFPKQLCSHPENTSVG